MSYIVLTTKDFITSILQNIGFVKAMIEVLNVSIIIYF